MNSIRIYILFALVTTISSCTKDQAAQACDGDCLPGVVSYETDIKPLILQSCATNQGPGTGCHDAWIFEYENVLSSVKGGNFKRVIVETRTMPKIPNNFNIEPLTEAEINLFECWICDGAPNN